MPHRRFVGDLPTPALLLDRDVLERNLAAMAAKARALVEDSYDWASISRRLVRLYGELTGPRRVPDRTACLAAHATTT